MSGKRKFANDAETRRHQASAIKRAKKQASAGGLESGQAHFILSSSWFKKWVSFTQDSPAGASPPGSIDNSDILDPTSPRNEPQLRHALLEHEDYEIVTEPEWKLFAEWYGGGPTIKRFVIGEGQNNQSKRVEVFLMDLIVMPCKKDGSPDEKEAKKIFLSKMSTLKELLVKASALFGFPPLSSRLWNFEDADKASVISDLDRSLSDEQLVYGQTILVEKQKKLGVWPRDRIAGKPAAPTSKKPGLFSRLFRTAGTSESKGDTLRDADSNRADQLPLGLCGLRNLGNTCFMNSALQCLSNMEPLRRYFLDDSFRSEINKNNPLGMKGQIAEQFGTLLKEMWSGEETAISPKSFKHTIGKFAPQFEGFNQHDAHELLSFVLDGLHEDLNRVQKKPYVEKKEGNGRPDPEVALEAWEGHLKRNRSIVVDLFHGLLKSTVTCPDCSKVSVTFDPFMNLSLPLLQETERPIEVILLRRFDRKTPYKYGPRVPKHGKVGDVREALSALVAIPANELVLAFIDEFRIDYIYEDTDPTSKIDQGEFLIAYEIPDSPRYIRIRGMHRRQRKRRSVAFGGPTFETFGLPFLFCIIIGETTGRELYEYAWMRCQRFIVLPASDDENGGGESEASSSGSSAQSQSTKRANLSRFDALPAWDSGDLPFRLSLVTSSGTHCARCGNGCEGCFFEPSDDPITLPADTRVSIALDWEDTVLENNFDDDEALSVRVHKSVSESRRDYSHKTEMTLDDCLKLFTTTERLGANDLWYCPECKEHRRAWKKFDIWSLPEVLVIHLKRFQFNRNFRTKLTVDVDFPLQGLSLDPYVINPEARGQLYDLCGVSNHMGGLGGGHYTAFCWNLHASRWFGFNDSMVTPVRTPDGVKTNTAYLLFYRRRPKGQELPLTLSLEPKSADEEPDSIESEEKSSPSRPAKRSQRSKSPAQRQNSTQPDEASRSSNPSNRTDAARKRADDPEGKDGAGNSSSSGSGPSAAGESD